MSKDHLVVTIYNRQSQQMGSVHICERTLRFLEPTIRRPPRFKPIRARVVDGRNSRRATQHADVRLTLRILFRWRPRHSPGPGHAFSEQDAQASAIIHQHFSVALKFFNYCTKKKKKMKCGSQMHVITWTRNRVHSPCA